jgi:hypothetical protein
LKSISGRTYLHPSFINFIARGVRKIWLLLLLPGMISPVVAQRADSVYAAVLAGTSGSPWLFPINPGKPNFLTGTMAEMRPNHFHGGLDVKTGGVTKVPVLAAADGYISRVKISSFGYGNVVNIKHPNGMTTLYAHLESLEEPLASHVLKSQYQQQVFEIEQIFEANQFPVKKGQAIALSGNTGGSAGPHLHFEIRDPEGNLINPLNYHFAEIRDGIAPEISALSLRPLSIEARVSNRFEFQSFPVIKAGNAFHLKDTLYAIGLVGLGVEAFDRLDGASNKNGIKELQMTVNGKPTYSFVLDNIPFEKSRQILRHTDFLAWKTTGRFFQNCYLEDGNKLPIYKTGPRKGKLFIKPDSLYRVQITVKDAYGNTSTATCLIKGKPARYLATRNPKALKPSITYEVLENILKVYATDTSRNPLNAELFVDKMRYDLIPSYTHNSRSVYLYDLRGGLPDSLTFCGRKLKFAFQQMIPSEKENQFLHQDASLTFTPGCLYDTLYLTYSRVKDVLCFNDALVPMNKHYRLTLKHLPSPLSPQFAVYAMGSGTGRAYEGGTWDKNEISFLTRSFGKFGIFADSTAPKIKLAAKSAVQVRVTVRDNLSGIASWRASINGQWILMRYEHKDALLYSDKLDKSIPLHGDFTLSVKDYAGNEAIFSTKI